MKIYFAFGFIMTVSHRLVVTFDAQVEHRHAYIVWNFCSGISNYNHGNDKELGGYVDKSNVRRVCA